MADIERSSNAVWNGDLRSGNGTISSHSGVLSDTPYSFATRFEQAPGTNPEELIAAAHAACFSMALSGQIVRAGGKPERIQTEATCVLSPQQPSGFKITKIRLHTHATVPGMEDDAFQEALSTAKQNCPVSQALSAIEIEAEGTLD